MPEKLSELLFVGFQQRATRVAIHNFSNIDWGISSFVATSQGELIDNPRFYIQSQSKLK
jgi:hypothetical protein